MARFEHAPPQWPGYRILDWQRVPTKDGDMLMTYIVTTVADRTYRISLSVTPTDMHRREATAMDALLIAKKDAALDVLADRIEADMLK